MSYAVETKKRKFDRILESLTDHSTPSRSSLNTRNNESTPSLVHSNESDSAKKQRLTPTPASRKLEGGPPTSLASHYLPSDRQAFLERLVTFRQVTRWRVPSTEPINAAAWAKRGWVCTDTDLVSCGSCKERLLVQVEEEDTTEKDNEGEGSEEEAYEVRSELHAEVIKKYQQMIVDAHTASCPWRRHGCDASIQRIEGLLNIGTAIAGLKERYDSVAKCNDGVPQVDSLSKEDDVNMGVLQIFRFEGVESPTEGVLAMAVCGWQRKDDDVLECRRCFRSLGLWLYRGDDPRMEHLDAINSHLEYCPWRSAEAQDTEIVVPEKEGGTEQSRQKLSGWKLVYQAMAKDNSKKGRTILTSGKASSESRVEEALTPEQKEKKMKDLLKRIKDIKKPFNVKSLLKRKEKSKS